MRSVIADLDAPPVLRNDSPHDREAETAAAPFRRIVGKKELLALGYGNTRTVVLDHDSHDLIDLVERRLHDDLPFSFRRFDRIVHEIDDHASDLLDIETDEWHVGREPRGD